jgi:oxygen-independent coproporphyrinogen III oxidase
MNQDFIKRYSAPVPRYTSYPTAPHFSASVGHHQYREWLATLPEQVRLSLYVHIPFCDTLCWYCGCSTKAVRRYDPVARYVGSLLAEMSNVTSHLQPTHSVTNIHWGGGSPNVLTPEHIMQVSDAMRAHFRVTDDAEFAVEIDPRRLAADRVAAFARAGVNRVSIGVQDFDPTVQVAINRQQSFDTTRQAVEMFRERGIQAVNIDLVYGLPHQTRTSVEDTIEQVLALVPNRVAVFGYAHLPSRMTHQRLIDTAVLPDTIERYAQAARISRILAGAGYVQIGLDHFARADDPLAQGQVHRNFQGYTTDAADALIGLGASSIGRLPNGYIQNAVATADYERRISEDGLATARGVVLTPDDRMRALVIERLMCDLSFPTTELRRRFGDAALPILQEADALIETDQDHLVERSADGFKITSRGRPFVRAIAACFDSYLVDTQGAGPARYSAGV